MQSAADDNPAAALERIDQKIVEMQKDMRHLNQVASRFSQIGSVPELKLENLEAAREILSDLDRERGTVLILYTRLEVTNADEEGREGDDDGSAGGHDGKTIGRPTAAAKMIAADRAST